jgi:hypothetical protein
LFLNSWAFPVSGNDCIVVASPDREGLLLLNPTAAWIWRNADLFNLVSAYASHFDISLDQANADLSTTLAFWEKLEPAPSTPHSSAHFAVPPISASYRLKHTTFLIRFASSEIADELSPRLAALEVAPSPPDYILDLCEHPTGTAVYRDGVRLAIEPLITAARAILLQEITRLAVPNRDFIAILHAGAVGNSEACVILAGASFSGKSTLCAALMLSGLLCYSDDSALLTTNFEIAGMPFALSIREGSWPLFPQLDRPRFLPSNLNGTTPATPPKALVFVNYQPETQTTILEPVEPFEALIAINQSGFWVEHTQPSIAAFIDWLARIPIHRLTYSDLQSAAATVRNLL